MKILHISHQDVYPPVGGAEIVTFNTIRHLDRLGYDVTLLSIVDKTHTNPEIANFCRCKQVKHDKKTSITGALSSLPTRTPYLVSRFYSKKVWKIIQGLIQEEDYDLVHIDGLHTAIYGLRIKRESDLPVVLREHNYETELIRSHYISHNNPITKFYWLIQYKKIERFEKQVSETLDRCIMISKKDETKLTENNPKACTSVVPAGVDTSYFAPGRGKPESNSLVFVGTMDWMPNVEGALWFSDEILPLIKEVLPGIKLYIVGRNPTRKIKSLEDSNVVVTGYVEDTRIYLTRGEVVIVPLKTGSGMRIKILNAMAMRKPVVSTSIGCEGISVTDGNDILIANDPEEFAERVLTLLRNEDKRRKIARASLDLVEENYRWETVTEELASQYGEIVGDQEN